MHGRAGVSTERPDRALNLKQISRRSRLKMGQERHRKEKEREMSNKLCCCLQQLCLSVRLHRGTRRILFFFCVRALSSVSTRSRWLVRHVNVLYVHLYNIGVIFTPSVYAGSRCPPSKAVYTCSISVVNLGWPICPCWCMFQSVCLVLFSLRQLPPLPELWSARRMRC